MDQRHTVDEGTRAALDEALDDEFKARATYRAVLDRYGPVRPFVNIVEAEQRHVDALLAQYRRLGLTPPADTWPERVELPDSLEEACRVGVQAEVDNAALYERLLAMTDDPPVIEVFHRLRDASQQRHLPAFRRCLERGGDGGPGRGWGGGPGRGWGGGGRRHRGGRGSGHGR